MRRPQLRTTTPEKPHRIVRLGRFLRRNIWDFTYAAILSVWLGN